jgi:hypothetical protein
MGSRNLKVYPVPETFLDGNFNPSKQLQQIQMIKSSQRIELVLAGNSFLFSMSAADMHYKVEAPRTAASS